MSDSPFLEIRREDWAPLATWETRPLSPSELERLGGVIQSVDIREVEAVYLPLVRLIRLRIDAARAMSAAQATFLGLDAKPVPFVIGLGGSVAVGKSTTARVLQALLSRGLRGFVVERITTDGFLYPNAELEKRGLLGRKGFPETYDQRRLLELVADLKSGVPEVHCPVYSHQAYDVLDEPITIQQPDCAIIEGLNVLQTGQGHGFVSDYFDFSIYVDADEADLRHWYMTRFEHLRRTAFQDPSAYFHRYAQLSDAEARDAALGFWTRINLPNLELNIRHTRERADLILEKARDHGIRRLMLRRI